MTPFIQNLVHPGNKGKEERWLLIYVFEKLRNPLLLDEVLAPRIVDNEIYSRIFIAGYDEHIDETLAALRVQNILRERLERVCPDLNEGVVAIKYSRNEKKIIAEKLDGTEKKQSEELIEDLRNLSFATLIRKSGGLMDAPHGLHYQKPSGRHVKQFLRASNALEENSAVRIISFYLLPQVATIKCDQIIVDTSGISAIAITVAYEALITGAVTKAPTVASHHSYGGLAQLHITKSKSTIFLISASTSGELQKKLVELGAPLENVVTIFHLGAVKEGAVVLGNLLHRSCTALGFSKIQSHEDKKCPLCENGSLAIRISNDQFTIDPPTINPITITRDDIPPEQIKALGEVAGLEFFRVFKRLPDRFSEIHLDVKQLFPQKVDEDHPNKEFLKKVREQWQRLISRGLTVNLSRLIFSTYEYSSELAYSAQGVWKTAVKHKDLRVISSRDLRNEPPEAESGALIIASCIDNSHELMSINRDLRQIQPNGSSNYLAVVLRSTSSSARSRLRTNLTFGDQGANTHGFKSVFSIDLPSDTHQTSWESELLLLKRIRDWAELSERSVHEEIQERISFLESATEEGITNGLFWPNQEKIQLKIRSDFTFIDTLGGERELSQADIFTSVSIALHSLRTTSKHSKKLNYNGYYRSILSPDNFIRFNDGVVQASILRAARNLELYYVNCEDDSSERIRNILVAQISNLENGDGEAITEFILAMLLKKLSLRAIDAAKIFECISNLDPRRFPILSVFSSFYFDNQSEFDWS